MKEFLFYKPEASGVDWKRIDSLRHVMEKRTASICSQRALLYTESFQSSEHEPYIIRKAKAFAHTLAHMDIYIQKHSLIFGNQEMCIRDRDVSKNTLLKYFSCNNTNITTLDVLLSLIHIYVRGSTSSFTSVFNSLLNVSCISFICVCCFFGYAAISDKL